MPLIENPEDIRLKRDDDVQALLGHPPGWFLRWGITMVAITSVLLLTLGWLVKYPDIITAEVALVTEQPPIRVFTPRSAKLDQLLVKDQQMINQGDLIAVLENSSDLNAIQQLKAFVEQSAQGLEQGNIDNSPPPALGQLGTLESAYADFRQQWKDYQRFVRRSGTFAKIRSFRSQIKELDALNDNIRLQQSTLQESYDKAKKKEDRLASLQRGGNASIQEVEDAQTASLQIKGQIENLESAIINNKVRAKQLEVSIIDLKQSRRKGTSDRELAVQTSIQDLQGWIAEWEQENLIEAPISGIISLPRPLAEQEYLQANSSFLAIVPEKDAGSIIGKANLPITGSGKVAIGQDVNIRLQAYPFQEYGILKGKVINKALIPENNSILLEIELTRGLTTTYGLDIEFSQEMLGKAQIITDKRRFLERVLDRVLSVWRNG